MYKFNDDIAYDQMIIGPLGTNCYILINEKSKECVIIDPAYNEQRIVKKIDNLELTPKAIFLTHGHCDHIGAAKKLAELCNIKIYAGKNEKITLKDPSINLSDNIWPEQISIEADEYLEDNQNIDIAGINILCLSTPGHTEGGMSYYVEKAKILFSGDTIFCESVGRTDFKGGSMKEIVDSIKNKILTLPGDTKIFTGHGESTTVEHEQIYNPFCQ